MNVQLGFYYLYIVVFLFVIVKDYVIFIKNMQEFHPSIILCVPLLLENLHKNIVKKYE